MIAVSFSNEEPCFGYSSSSSSSSSRSRRSRVADNSPTLTCIFFSAVLLLLKRNFSSDTLFVSATITCTPDNPELGDSFCAEKYREGSYCTANGICSNPFTNGCLRNVLPTNFTKLRTCNSDDDAGAVERGECAVSSFGYEEVRILSQDWESSMFSSWIMQIVLSELLDVPTTIETGKPDTEASLNFYDPALRFSYSESSYDYDALSTALVHGDCESFQADRRKNEQEYKSCGHVMPEAWNGQNKNIEDAEKEGLIEPSTGSGGVAKYSWYIPRFTAERNPMLLSHFGMRSGQDMENRRIMAEAFLRPQTWKYFCDEISSDNCTTPYYDDEGQLIAARAPSDESEEVRYFSAESFHGHFAATADNDCDANPSCTGHISNVQCDWSTFAIPQAHYFKIPVKGSGPGVAGGYPYGQMVDIYNAANYTKSNVLFYWFTPDATVQKYIGTDAEFQRILLAPSTEQCTEARVTIEQRCSENPEDRIGEAAGSCDAEAHSYQKLIVSNMYKRTYEVDDASRSPAYDAIKSIQISDLHLDYMFRKWNKRNVDHWSYDPRDAVCVWAGENIDTLQRFVPRSYPRSIRVEKYDQPALYGAMIIAAICGILIWAVTAVTFHYRKKKVMVYAQPVFLFLLLLGLLFVCIGAILYAATPSHGTCIAREWFVLLGSSLELVPLIVKVAAINVIFQSAVKFKRVKLEHKNLYMTVGAIIGLVVIYLLVWTIMDPSTMQLHRTLTSELNEDSDQVIEINYSCTSHSSVWLVIAYIYQFLLLVAATVLAFQSRNVKQEFNESSRLGFVIYAHFLFVLLRSLVWILRSAIKENVAAAITSYLLSADIIMTLAIYFVPKIMAARVCHADHRGTKLFILYSSGKGLGISNNERQHRQKFSVSQIRLMAARSRLEYQDKMNKLNLEEATGLSSQNISTFVSDHHTINASVSSSHEASALASQTVSPKVSASVSAEGE